MKLLLVAIAALVGLILSWVSVDEVDQLGERVARLEILVGAQIRGEPSDVYPA